MGDMVIADSAFTCADMILTALDSLTFVWGSALANNTGYLAHRPVMFCQISTPMIEYRVGALRADTYCYFFPSIGTWRFYYSMAGSTLNRNTAYMPDLWLDGSHVVANGGTIETSRAGSFLWVVSEECPVAVRLETTTNDNFINCHFALQGVYLGGDLTT